MLRPHIVILGSGFGGTYVAKKLASEVRAGKIDVTIVNKTNYFLFTPLLHEVATGSLGPLSVAEPLREAFIGTGIELCQGTVQSIDAENHRVHITSNGNRHTLPYDYLVIVTGAETNYYNITGAEKYTLPLKTLSDAVRIRTQIIDSFEEAIMAEDPAERARLLSFVVVGGGPTGVETAAELNEFVHSIISRYYAPSKSRVEMCGHEEAKVSLIHMGSEVLQQFSPALRTATENRLRESGVILHLNSTVTNVTAQGIALTKTEPSSSPASVSIPAATIIWAAGVKPIIPDFDHETLSLVGGRMPVDEYFHLITGSRLNPQEKPAADERVFVLGDVAAYLGRVTPETPTDPALPAKPLPMLAQVATRQASTVALNILASIDQKPLKTFRFESAGSMVSVGKWFAIGEFFSKDYSGRFVWWMWRTVYLFKFASWKKRVRIAFDWTLGAFSSRDITKLT